LKMKILVLGCTGMLGKECKEVLGQDHEVITPDKKDLDIISWDGVIENLQEVLPDVVLNCAGFTDVDACETEDFKVRKINVEGPRNLAQCSARFECKFIHISSDYVFDGQKPFPQPYFEDDAPNPLSAYGKSKMESEKAVRENAPNYIIVRTAWLYGIHGNNFIKSIVKQAAKKKPKEGYCSRLECAEFIIKKLGLKAKVEPCSMKDLPDAAKRPYNCLLENRLLKKQGLSVMPDWKEDLDTFLEKFGEGLIKEAKEIKS
jgi:dTDP-4-dehydrorhamnose reductase